MSYSIPLFKLNFNEEEIHAVTSTIRTHWISTGPVCDRFETLFAQKIQTPYALTLSSCTSALHLAMRILDIGKKDEVICPSLTFAATVNAIRYVDATPVFCDIVSSKNLNIDPLKIIECITPRTKAIIVVHYGGFPCDMGSIMEIAKKHKLKVVEDASHAPSSEYLGKKLGTFGDVGCFSFFSNKNISTGEGGMIVMNEIELYQRAKLLRSHGMTTMSYQRAQGHATEYDILELGYNYRMDDIRASIGIVQLEKIDNDYIERDKRRQLYLNIFEKMDELILPFAENEEYVSNYIFPVVLKNSSKEFRNFIRDSLHQSGIQTSNHYPSIHKFSAYQNFYKSLPLTEYVSDNEITLPMYGSLTVDEIEYICFEFEKILKR